MYGDDKHICGAYISYSIGTSLREQSVFGSNCLAMWSFVVSALTLLFLRRANFLAEIGAVCRMYVRVCVCVVCSIQSHKCIYVCMFVYVYDMYVYIYIICSVWG